MDESRQQAGQHVVISVSGIKTTQNTYNGRNLFNQSSKEASYQTVPQNNHYQYVKRIHNLEPRLSPAGTGFGNERINGLK